MLFLQPRILYAVLLAALFFALSAFQPARAFYYDTPQGSCGFTLNYIPTAGYDGAVMYIRDAGTNQLWSSRIAYANVPATIVLYDEQCFRRYKIAAMPVTSRRHRTSGDPYDAMVIWIGQNQLFQPRIPAAMYHNRYQGRYYFTGWPLRGNPRLQPNDYVNLVFPVQFRPPDYRKRNCHRCCQRGTCKTSK